MAVVHDQGELSLQHEAFLPKLAPVQLAVPCGLKLQPLLRHLCYGEGGEIDLPQHHEVDESLIAHSALSHCTRHSCVAPCPYRIANPACRSSTRSCRHHQC